MNAHFRIGVGLGMLASAALGGLAVEQLHAQVTPPVYFVGEIDVSNPDGYAKEYLPKGETDHQGARRPFDRGGRSGGKRRSGDRCRR